MELKNIQNIIHDNMMAYSGYVITSRALPDLRDGLKPSYRRILITMDKMKINGFTKSQNVSGQTMKIHPHGDCYLTIVGMVQTDNNITPLIKGKGSFGQHTSKELQAAAPRYTEICLSDISKDIFKDINKNMVNFIPNYDGTIMIPEVLPVKFPSVLHYCQSGIAVGMSCNFPSHNLIELNDATKYYIQTGCHKTIAPDFATGGELVNDEIAFRQIAETGTGTIRLRAKVEVNDRDIIITEIPYTTTREAIIEQIIKLIKAKKIDTIANVQDLTGLQGMKIKITAKRNANMDVLLSQLFKMTPMESAFSANMNVLVDKLPKVLGTNKIIEEWVVWRRECIKNGIRFELENLNEKLHRLLGLEKILLDIDKAIEIIRKSPEDKIDANLMNHFNIDDIQAEYISNIKLRNLNKDVILRQTAEIQSLRNQIKDKEDALPVDYANAGIKEGDRIVNEFLVTNKSEIGVFVGTDMYKIYISNFNVNTETDFGVFLPTYLNVPDIKGYTLIDDSVKYTLIIYDNMKVAKIENKAYKTASKRTKLENSLFSGANVVQIITLLDDTDLEIVWNNKSTIYNTSKIRAKASRGSQGVTLRNDSISVL